MRFGGVSLAIPTKRDTPRSSGGSQFKVPESFPISDRFRAAGRSVDQQCGRE